MQSDIDAILCTKVFTYIAGKRVNLLDHDNGTFFGDFFSFLGKQNEVKDLLKIQEA